MLRLLQRFYRRPVDQEAAQAKILDNETKKAEKRLKVLRGLLRRQPDKLYHDIAYEVYGCKDMLFVYARPSKIRVEDRIEGLQRLNSEIKHLEKVMRKHRLSLFSWIAQEWRGYRINRAHRLEQARRQKRANNDFLYQY